MNVQNFCKTYFNGFQNVSNYKENDTKTTALAVVKIISYFTVVIPLAFGAATLYARVSKKESLSPEDKRVDYVAKESLLPKTTIVIRPELANLSALLTELHNELCSEMRRSDTKEGTKEHICVVGLDGLEVQIGMTMKRRSYSIPKGAAFCGGKLSKDIAEITINFPLLGKAVDKAIVKEVTEVITDHFKRQILPAFGMSGEMYVFDKVFINGNKVLFYSEN